jgi:mono/diheme cytochrome c family protein
LACAIAGPLLATVQMSPVTYYRDVLPILQKHCISCHRPGQIAPMSFTSYRQIRPWAEAIRYVVTTAKMPPWNGASPGQGDHTLSEREVDTLVQWVEGGSVAGDPKDAAPPAFPEECRLPPHKARTQRAEEQ